MVLHRLHQSRLAQFPHNGEVNAVVLGNLFARQMRKPFDANLAQSDAVELPAGSRARYEIACAKGSAAYGDTGFDDPAAAAFSAKAVFFTAGDPKKRKNALIPAAKNWHVSCFVRLRRATPIFATS